MMIVLCLSSCTEEPLNIQKQFEYSIKALGVVPLYPVYEDVRVGQVYLIDLSYLEAPKDTPTFVPFGVLVTNAAVDQMEAMRSRSTTTRNRFPCTVVKGDNNDSATLPSGKLFPLYHQPSCGRETTNNSNNPPPDPDPWKHLQLVGFPSYSLVNIQDVTLGGFIPSTWGQFWAKLGLKELFSLSIDVEGVEIATLSTDEMWSGIKDLCINVPIFQGAEDARNILLFAKKEMDMYDHYRDLLINNSVHNSDTNGNDAQKKRRLIMLKKVFYLRGIRYRFSNETLMAAALEASLNPYSVTAQPTQQLSPAVTAQPSPQVQPVVIYNYLPPQSANDSGKSSNVTPAPQAARPEGNLSQADTSKVLEQVSAFQNKLDSIVLGSSNSLVKATYAQASAQGIDFFSVFDRPVAFGFVAIDVEYDDKSGLQRFCKYGKEADGHEYQ